MRIGSRLLLTFGLAAGAFAADLDTALARIDKAAASFKGLTADMKRMHHVELVNSNEEQEGTITVKKVKPGDTRILINFSKPEPQIVAIGNGKGQMYNPKTKEVQEADIKRHKDLINEVLLLGFGASAAELKQSYDITPGGIEPINGVPAIRIQLVPKNEDIRHQIKKCELWIPENGIPLQQKFYETGGDYQIASYTKIVLSANVPDASVKLELPKGVKVSKIDK